MFKHSLFVALSALLTIGFLSSSAYAQDGEQTTKPQDQLEKDLALFWGKSER